MGRRGTRLLVSKGHMSDSCAFATSDRGVAIGVACDFSNSTLNNRGLIAFRRLCSVDGPGRPIGITRRGSVGSSKRAILVARHVVGVRAATASGGNGGRVRTKGSMAVISGIALSNLRIKAGCGLSN